MAIVKNPGKDKLVSADTNLTDPGNAKFKVAGTPKMGAGMQGMNKLVDQPMMSCCPGDMESDGADKPMPTDRSARVSANFKTSVSKAESGTAKSVDASVDFKTGKHSSFDQKR
jgi:hypothetical protein